VRGFLAPALVLVVAGCTSLTPQQHDRVVEVQQFADATAAYYKMFRVGVVVEPATNLGIGARYRQGNFYLNVRMLGSRNLMAVVAHELAHYVLSHDMPVAGASTTEFLRAQEFRELEANAKAVEILVRVKGMSERDAVQMMINHLRGAQSLQERGGALAPGHRPPAEEIADLLARYPGSR
jgi:hypothetical protein